MPRRLGPDEKTLWGKVIATVKPLHAVKAKIDTLPPFPSSVAEKGGASPQAPRRPDRPGPGPGLGPKGEGLKAGLDGHWDRHIHRGGIVPDISIDLHDASLSRAYARLDGALEQAIAQRLKVILLVTGKPRAHDRASGEGRGAIAAVVRDWLAASRHARHISAVRNAHPRHGGAGALYIILKS